MLSNQILSIVYNNIGHNLNFFKMLIKLLIWLLKTFLKIDLRSNGQKLKVK